METSFADMGGQSRTVVCKHPKRKHMAYSCQFFWNGDISSKNEDGVAGIWLFFCLLTLPLRSVGCYLQSESLELACSQRLGERPLHKGSSFCSALFVLRSASLLISQDCPAGA